MKNAADLMSAPVISVGPHTPVLQVAAILRERRIGGVPVLQDNALVGMVTEKDLLHRWELGTEEFHQAVPWWRKVVASDLRPQHYVRSHGRCAEHVMSRNLVTVERSASLRDVMALLDRNRIGRVPVMSAGHMVGILTCADLVRALSAGSWIEGPRAGPTTDEGIRESLLAELSRQDWWISGSCEVRVEQGVVHFIGFVESEPLRRASRVAAENMRGVQRVVDKRVSFAELPIMF